MGGVLSLAGSFRPEKDLVELRGKVVIVTGGNRGIGYGTVLHLARSGAKVYIAARDERSATTAIEQLKKGGLGPGHGEVLFLKLDLLDMRATKKAAEEFLAKETRLDILVNNAGKVYGVYGLSPDGVSDMVAVNYLGPYLFTRTLLPLLKKTAEEPDSDVRIVSVASIAHKLTGKLKLDTPQDLNVTGKPSLLPDFMRYSYSKLLPIIWTKWLQKQLDEDGIPITVIAPHPGGADTFTHSWPVPRFSKWLVGLFIRDIEHGAYNSVFAAASTQVRKEREKYKGAYLESRPTGSIQKPSAHALDPAVGDQLNKVTEELLSSIGIPN